MLSSLTKSTAFFTRLPAGRPDEAHRIEGVLASARAFLAARILHYRLVRRQATSEL